MRLHLAIAAMLVATVAFSSTASALAGAAAKEEGCSGHVAYVLPITYECKGDCTTHYYHYVPTGCTTNTNETLGLR